MKILSETKTVVYRMPFEHSIKIIHWCRNLRYFNFLCFIVLSYFGLPIFIGNLTICKVSHPIKPKIIFNLVPFYSNYFSSHFLYNFLCKTYVDNIDKMYVWMSYIRIYYYHTTLLSTCKKKGIKFNKISM